MAGVAWGTATYKAAEWTLFSTNWSNFGVFHDRHSTELTSHSPCRGSHRPAAVLSSSGSRKGLTMASASSRVRDDGSTDTRGSRVARGRAYRWPPAEAHPQVRRSFLHPGRQRRRESPPTGSLRRVRSPVDGARFLRRQRAGLARPRNGTSPRCPGR